MMLLGFLLNWSRISLFRALTGISLADFKGLLPAFTGAVQAFLMENKECNQKKNAGNPKNPGEAARRAIGA
jgi:hypothetical protein